MTRKYIRCIILAILILYPVITLGEVSQMEPAPDDRPKYEYKKEPGQYKRNKWGMIDPTPDVVSLGFLPKDKYGFVDWVKSLNDGLIAPRGSINIQGREEQQPEFNQDVLIRAKMDFMPDVIFPHSAHVVWLKCTTCHPKIFKMKAGETPISMAAIWKGKFCGRCHDRVAFPTRNCLKCHTAPKAVKK